MMKMKLSFIGLALTSVLLYGQPADITKQFDAVVKVTEGSKEIKNEVIESDEDGKNAVFVQGNNSILTGRKITIKTKKDGSRGFYAAFGGSINVKDVDVSTEGEHCAAFATDMGEGNVTVEKGKALTKGKGSPVIYSTGNIAVKNLTGLAENSEMAVIEGKNSVLIQNSNLKGGSGLDGEISAGVMLYQSMSGDANVGTASFTSKNSSLTNLSSGPFFYVTNTKGIVSLEKTKLMGNTKVLLLASGNNSERGWGKKGFNGGQLALNLTCQNAEGDVILDKISSVKMNLGKKSFYKGCVNSAKEGKADIYIEKSAKLEITGDSYFNKFVSDAPSFDNVKSNGHMIYYNKNLEENEYLKGRTILLSDGGKIIPTEYDFSDFDKSNSSEEKNSKIPLPAPGENKKIDERPAPGKEKDFTSLEGTINVVADKVLLIDEENKATFLTVMDAPDSKREKNNGFPGKNGRPPRGEMKGNMPNMKENMPENNSGFPKDGPKPLSLEDIKKFAGKKVSVTGIMKNDGTLLVFTIEEKK